MRCVRLLAAIGLLTCACTDDGKSGGLRSFDLEGEAHEGEERPEAPHVHPDWRFVQAVVVEAPAVVTAGEDVGVVIELRNPQMDPVAVDECPVWSGGFGHEDEFVALTGLLPCDEIGQLGAGERIQLRLSVPAPSVVGNNEGGEHAAFTWALEGELFLDVTASVAIPMQEAD
jgi:hypothetical protein